MNLVRLWRDQGKPQQARELLAPVYGWFTEAFDTLDLRRRRWRYNSLLDEHAIGHFQRGPSTGYDALSRISNAMKRRSRGGELSKGRRPKTPEPQRCNAPKAIVGL